MSLLQGNSNILRPGANLDGVVVINRQGPTLTLEGTSRGYIGSSSKLYGYLSQESIDVFASEGIKEMFILDFRPISAVHPMDLRGIRVDCRGCNYHEMNCAGITNGSIFASSVEIDRRDSSSHKGVFDNWENVFLRTNSLTFPFSTPPDFLNSYQNITWDDLTTVQVVFVEGIKDLDLDEVCKTLPSTFNLQDKDFLLSSTRRHASYPILREDLPNRRILYELPRY